LNLTIFKQLRVKSRKPMWNLA